MSVERSSLAPHTQLRLAFQEMSWQLAIYSDIQNKNDRVIFFFPRQLQIFPTLTTNQCQ